jgi:hypothetical protein
MVSKIDFHCPRLLVRAQHAGTLPPPVKSVRAWRQAAYKVQAHSTLQEFELQGFSIINEICSTCPLYISETYSMIVSIRAQKLDPFPPKYNAEAHFYKLP